MIFTEEDLKNIEKAKKVGGEVWDNELLKDLKKKIKEHYRSGENEECCYCRRDFTDEFNMVIDIEHILPKSKYNEFMFELENLNISCKRCNMNIKKEKHDFVVNVSTIKNDFKTSSQYHFIHPNFDKFEDHIDHHRIVFNKKKLTKYVPKTDKGEYAYKYFYLDRLEINTINRAQGIVVKEDGNIITSEVNLITKNKLIELLSQL